MREWPGHPQGPDAPARPRSTTQTALPHPPSPSYCVGSVMAALSSCRAAVSGPSGPSVQLESAFIPRPAAEGRGSLRQPGQTGHAHSCPHTYPLPRSRRGRSLCPEARSQSLRTQVSEKARPVRPAPQCAEHAPDGHRPAARQRRGVTVHRKMLKTKHKYERPRISVLKRNEFKF